MSNVVLIWLGLAIASAVEGAVWHVALLYIASRRQYLDERSYDAPPDPAPFVSMIVAARDEERNIEACVTTMLAQDYPNFEVIAVDDRSTDRTPELLRELEASSGSRLRVVTIEELEEGWFGKNNAMREGVARAGGEWLCFTDADCWFTSNRALTVAMREALETGADFLTLLPMLEQKTTWEQVIQPACAIMMVSWFQPLRVNNPRSKVAYANGQFMLMNRACYDGIGGHHRVRTELNEDMVMGRYAKEDGYRLRVVENIGLSRTHMYATIAEAWYGWSRIFHGSIPSIAQLALAAVWHAVFAVGPWISWIVALAGLAFAPADSTVPWAKAAGLWTIGLLAHQSVLWRVYGMMHCKRVFSLTHVVGASALIGMLTSAILKTLGITATTWRGVTYRSGRLERDGNSPSNAGPAESAVATSELSTD